MAIGIAKRSEKLLDVHDLEANEVDGLPKLCQRILEFRDREGQFPFVLLISEEQHKMIQRVVVFTSSVVPWVDTEVLDKGYRQEGWLMGVPYTVVGN